MTTLIKTPRLPVGAPPGGRRPARPGNRRVKPPMPADGPSPRGGMIGGPRTAPPRRPAPPAMTRIKPPKMGTTRGGRP